jgi:hypothetical protein
MQYDSADARSRDLSDRIAFIRTTMLPDADALAHVFEKFARENTGDPVVHSGCRRLATALRDFHSHVMQSFAAMPAINKR